jgi:hypothetical protein
MNQRDLPFDQTVADRIHALLARCEQLRRGTTIARPTRFNREGQQHAEAIAQRDQMSFSGTSTRSHE